MQIECKISSGVRKWAKVIGAEITEPDGNLAFTEKGDICNTADIVALYFVMSPKLKYFPRDLHTHFPILKHLIFSRSGIKTISNQDLTSFDKLETFRMNSCHLTSLPDDLFTNMTTLSTISFFDNQLSFLPTNLLNNLPKLRSVSFAKNRLTSLSIDFFKNIQNPVDLIFNDNQLDSATSKLLEHFAKTNNDENLDDIDESTEESLVELMRNIEETENQTVESEANMTEVDNFGPAIKKLRLTYQEFSNNLNISNVLEAILFANQLEAINSRELKNKAFKIIEDNLTRGPLPEALKKDLIKLKKLIDNQLEYEKLMKS